MQVPTPRQEELAQCRKELEEQRKESAARPPAVLGDEHQGCSVKVWID